MNDRLLRISLTAALLATLAGCGNKGPLVHPQSPADEMAVPATTTAPVDATLPTPASTAPATPTDATPSAETTPPPPPPPGGH